MANTLFKKFAQQGKALPVRCQRLWYIVPGLPLIKTRSSGAYYRAIALMNTRPDTEDYLSSTYYKVYNRGPIHAVKKHLSKVLSGGGLLGERASYAIA